MRIFIVLPLLFLLTNCQDNPKNIKDFNERDGLTEVDVLEGKKLMEQHCYLCHSPKADEISGRIAPPMIAIKAHYLDKLSLTKDAFVSEIESFVENPTKDKVHLKGALKKFGLMPKQVFPKGSVQKIAHFMFDYQIEEPHWFKSHWEGHGYENWKQSGKVFKDDKKAKSYEEIGLHYALETKKLLGKNLMEAIQQKGTLAALNFCNLQAMPLTDSMSQKFNAQIKRVSDRNRNPNNKANAEEMHYIAQFQKQLVNQKEINPVVLNKNDKMQFYFPIETNTLCLQCHGKKIETSVQNQIWHLYPKDLAVGYDVNEIRGIWSITFKK